jgi:hypothetical protein
VLQQFYGEGTVSANRLNDFTVSEKLLQLIKDLTASTTDPGVESSTHILRYDYQFNV